LPAVFLSLLFAIVCFQAEDKKGVMGGEGDAPKEGTITLRVKDQAVGGACFDPC
jgi:hypothetical protein